MKKGVLCVAGFLLLLSAFSQGKATKDLLFLKQSLTGDFDNKQQSSTDTSFLPVIIHIRQVWPKRKDGFWLYMEESVQQNGTLERKQRMWHLYVQDDSTFISQVFDFKEPSLLAGGWATPNRFDSVKFTALNNKVGCEVYLRKKQTGLFSGATDGKDCYNQWKGASYATTEMTIERTGFSIEEKGWNAEETQVWGQTKGPYRFRRLSRK